MNKTNEEMDENNGARGFQPARIVSGGMGCFLNPPGHPEHSYHVETYADWWHYQRSEPDGLMSLTTALLSEYISGGMQRRIDRILTGWEASKPALDAPECREWIRRVMRHFATCYRGDESLGQMAWYAGNVRIRHDWDPMVHTDEHCGVHLIRKYYPEYMPVWQDFGEGAFTVYEGLDGEPLWSWRLDTMAWIRTERVATLRESYRAGGQAALSPQWFPGVLIENDETKKV